MEKDILAGAVIDSSPGLAWVEIVPHGFVTLIGMSLDTLLTIGMACCSCVLAALGILASFNPPSPSEKEIHLLKRTSIRIWAGMFAFAVISVALAVLQSHLNTKQQDRADAKSTHLQASLNLANEEIQSSHSDLRNLRTSQDQLIGSVNTILSTLEHSADTKTVNKTVVVQALKSAVSKAASTPTAPSPIIQDQTTNPEKMTDDELISNAEIAAAKLLNLCSQERAKIKIMDPKNQDIVAREMQSGEIQAVRQAISEYQSQILLRAHNTLPFAPRGIRGNSEMGAGNGFVAIVGAEHEAQELQSLLNAWRDSRVFQQSHKP